MIEFKIRKTTLINTIKKAAIPVRSRKEKFLFPKITLTVKPDNELEWIGRIQYVTVWIRVKCTVITNISEPMQIPIDSQKILSYSKDFKNKNLISFMYDPDQGLTHLVNEKENDSRKLVMNAPAKTDMKGLLERLPYKLEDDTEIILFLNGQLKPNISGSCDVKIFKDLVKNAIANKKIELSDIKERSLKKKIKDEPLKYNIYIDSNLNQIKTVAGSEHSKYKIVDRLSANVNGSGELHYSSGFAEVINVLSGEIKFYAVENGPLWIMQDIKGMKLRYLIAPTPESICWYQ